MGIRQRERILIIATLVCLGVFLGDRIILTPLARAWSRRSERIAELKKSVEKGALLLSRQAEVERRWKAIQDAGLPDDPSQVEERVLGRVQEWESQSSLALSSLKPRWRETDDESKKLEIRLTASGSLDSIARFLYEAEADALPVCIEDVGLTSRDRRGDTLDLNLKFSSLILKGKIK
ncbi:MAG TPA: hypothetical protein P5557_10620 [Candidatus Sumerlaeia bacterium]|nr:hypothetical protein [Candidatus Sumerlaeia bacterium]HRS00842.1 hypothetical protein [Candidatus Sumerlaeia bacterium]